MGHQIVLGGVDRGGAMANDLRQFGEIGRVGETGRAGRFEGLFACFVEAHGVLQGHRKADGRERLGLRRSVGAEDLHVAVLVTLRIEAGERYFGDGLLVFQNDEIVVGGAMGQRRVVADEASPSK